MALPNVTNNDPSPGHISWELFHIQYEGVGYEVPAGSTSDKWVWWNFNGGSPILESGAVVPETLTADDLLLLGNKDGIAIRVQSSNLIDGELIVDGSILADAIAVNQINSQHIVTMGLDAGVIKFGAMSGDRILVNTLLGDRIAANTVSTEKLLIGSTNNMLNDPTFESELSAGWNSTIVGTSIDPTGARDGGRALKIVNQAVQQAPYNLPYEIPIEAGEAFAVTSWARNVGAALPAGRHTVGLRFKLTTGAFAYGGVNNTAALDGEWTRTNGIVTAPPNAVSVSLYVASQATLSTGILYVDFVSLTNASTGELIVDGSIVGKHIFAEAITTRELGAQAVTAEKVATKAIDVTKVNIGDLTNYAVDGDFGDPLSSNWRMSPDLQRFNIAGSPPYMEISSKVGANVFMGNQKKFDIDAGDEFHFNLEYSTPSTNVDPIVFSLGCEVFNVDGASQLWRFAEQNMSIPPNTPWTEMSGSLIIDDPNLFSAWFNSVVEATATANQKLRIRRLTMRKKGSGELIVDGTITARHIDADSVSAAVINTKILQSQLSITGNLTIAGSNMGWSKARGLYIGADVAFYDDGRTSRVEGDLVTENITVKDGLSLGGNADLNGKMIAKNGISTPTAKMSLGQTWLNHPANSIDPDMTIDWSNAYQDIIEYDANRWLTAVNYFGTTLRLVNKTGGWAGDMTIGNWKKTFSPLGGLTKIGTDIYILGSDSSRANGNYYIYRINSAGTKIAEFFVTGVTNLPKRARLITNGTNVGMIWTQASTGNLVLRWHNAALTATVGSDIILMSGVGVQHVGGAHYGIGQTGGTARIWVSLFTGDSNLVRCFTTAGVPVTTEDFPRAFNAALIGLSYDSSTRARMVSVDKYSEIYMYSGYVTGGTFNAQYTYYDGNTAVYPAGTIINGVNRGGQASGAHETSPSPVNSFALSRRAYPTVVAPPAPDELVTDVTQVDKADRIGLYASVGGTPILQAYLAKGVRTIAVTDALATSGVAAGASTVPSFATASVPSPGEFASGAVQGGSPTWRLPGSGDGRVGPYRWDVLSRPLNHGEWSSNTAQAAAAGIYVVRTGYSIWNGNSPVHGINYDGAGGFTVSQSGIYLLAASLGWEGGTSGRRLIGICQNGSVRFRNESTGGGAVSVAASGVIYLASGDEVDVRGIHTNAANYIANREINYLSITCLGAF